MRDCRGYAQEQLAFVAVKSYGDLIIQQHALSRIEHCNGNAPFTIYGDHLAPLYRALDRPSSGIELALGEGDVPSCYDVKKRGVLKAISSAVRLRMLLNSVADHQKDARLVFDRIGFRERVLAGGRRAAQLPAGEPNIYLAYERFLFEARFTIAASSTPKAQEVGRIGIFTRSRIPTKDIPDAIVLRVFKELRQLGFDPVGFAMPGDHVPPELQPDFRRIEKTFSAAREAVVSCCAVISADTMPAHMAGYFGIPVYVLTPVANEYWLPRDSYEKRRWRTFLDFLSDAEPVAQIVKSLNLSN